MKNSFTVVWTRRAIKQLKNLEQKHQIMLFNWVDNNLDGCVNPNEIQGAKKLQGTKAG